MKFSVIIPTYKGNDTLEIAISSVLYQSFNNYEIIISDDNDIGSVEQKETESIVNKYIKNNNKIIYLKNGHHNGSFARNRGIEIASGDYITLLDDDDFYLKDYLKCANSILEENRQIELLFFDVVTITPEHTIKKASYPDIDPKKLLYREAEIGTGSNLCFKNNKKRYFDERYLRHQDIEFACKTMNQCKYQWNQEIEIIKFYNKNDNYPNAEKGIKMQRLLREDMLKNNIIGYNDIKELENTQLHFLFNDLLVKNAPKEEIKKVRNILKENIYYSFRDALLFLIYCISKNIFNLLFNIYSKRKFNMVNKDLVNQFLNIRIELERMSK